MIGGVLVKNQPKKTTNLKKRQNNMITLVIWEQVPEQTDLYLIPNSEIDDEMRVIMQGAHNKLINSDDDVEDALKLNAALSPKDDGRPLDEQEYPVDEKYFVYWGRFAQYKVDNKYPVQDTHVTFIYLSGWYL